MSSNKGNIRRGPRCSATTKAGKPCQALASLEDGLCAAHSGRVNMVEIGHMSAKARRINGTMSHHAPEKVEVQVRNQLRNHIAENIDLVWEAFESGLTHTEADVRARTASELVRLTFGPLKASAGKFRVPKRRGPKAKHPLIRIVKAESEAREAS